MQRTLGALFNLHFVRTLRGDTNLGDIMGAIFKDVSDDQQEAMMETIYVGQTWQFRYMRVRYIFWGMVSTVTGIVGTATVDYGIYKFTDYSGILGWLLG